MEEKILKSKINSQILDLDKSKYLSKFGLDSNKPSICWRILVERWDRSKVNINERVWHAGKNEPIIVMNFESFDEYPTYTLSEILDMLPKEITVKDKKDTNKQITYYLRLDIGYAKTISYGTNTNDGKVDVYVSFDIEDTLLNAAYKMFVWAIENGYIKTARI